VKEASCPNRTGGAHLKSNVRNTLLNLFSGGMEKVTGAPDAVTSEDAELKALPENL